MPALKPEEYFSYGASPASHLPLRTNVVSIRALLNKTLEMDKMDGDSSHSGGLSTTTIVPIAVFAGFGALLILTAISAWLMSRRAIRHKNGLLPKSNTTTATSSVLSTTRQPRPQATSHAQPEMRERLSEESMSVIDVCADHFIMHEPRDSPPPRPSTSSTASHYSQVTYQERPPPSTWRRSRARPLPIAPLPPLPIPPPPATPPLTSRPRRFRRPRTRRIAHDGGVRLEEGDGVPSMYRSRTRTRSIATIASGTTGHSTSESTNTLPPPYGRCDTPEDAQNR